MFRVLVFLCVDRMDRHPLPFQCRIVPRMKGMDGEKLEEVIIASDE